MQVARGVGESASSGLDDGDTASGSGGSAGSGAASGNGFGGGSYSQMPVGDAGGPAEAGGPAGAGASGAGAGGAEGRGRERRAWAGWRGWRERVVLVVLAGRPAAPAEQRKGRLELSSVHEVESRLRSYGNILKPRSAGLWKLGFLSTGLTLVLLLVDITVMFLLGPIAGIAAIVLTMPVVVLLFRPDVHGRNGAARLGRGGRRAARQAARELPVGADVA